MSSRERMIAGICGILLVAGAGFGIAQAFSDTASRLLYLPVVLGIALAVSAVHPHSSPKGPES